MTSPKFSGDPTARWLTEPGTDRRMELLDEFWFDDGKGKVWEAPAGSIVDGASIPKPLWSLVGSPYTGEYRRASIVHDIACVAAVGNPAARKAADKMFYRACRVGGCSVRESIVLYIGVRIGARWKGTLLAAEEQQVQVHESEVDEAVREEFQALADEVLAQDEIDDADVVDQQVEQAERRLVARKALIAEAGLLA